MPQPYTIGITGGSGSGKTFFIKELSSHFRPEEICLISQDHYYKPLDAQFTDEKGVQNFDLPTSIDKDALAGDILMLKSGRSIVKKGIHF